MSNRWKYYPDYRRLYPGVKISPEILAALKKSDRKMKYMEYDIKTELPIKDENGHIIMLLPGREDSLERLMDVDVQFAVFAPPPEQAMEEREEIERLHHALSLLSEDERELVHALFMDKLTEREYADRIGLSQPRVSQLWSRIRQKLKNIMLDD